MLLGLNFGVRVGVWVEGFLFEVCAVLVEVYVGVWGEGLGRKGMSVGAEGAGVLS